jgi:hypothetical protein
MYATRKGFIEMTPAEKLKEAIGKISGYIEDSSKGVLPKLALVQAVCLLEQVKADMANLTAENDRLKPEQGYSRIYEVNEQEVAILMCINCVDSNTKPMPQYCISCSRQKHHPNFRPKADEGAKNE